MDIADHVLARETSLMIKESVFPEETSLHDLDNMNELQQRLSLVVGKMLRDDYQGLLNLLYRVDVNEKKYREAIAQKDTTQISSSVAKLIIDRLVEKYIFRRRYNA
jgi:hypothetical protein